jgi:hypothetical protein
VSETPARPTNPCRGHTLGASAMAYSCSMSLSNSELMRSYAASLLGETGNWCLSMVRPSGFRMSADGPSKLQAACQRWVAATLVAG